MSIQAINQTGSGLRFVTVSAVLAVAMTVPAAAVAQSDSDLVLEEIVVTATKRAVSIQDLALSVSALSGSDLEDQVSVNFADYAQTAPGLSYNGGEPGNEKLVVRGISTDSFNAQLQSTVGIYIDDMPGISTFIPTTVPDLHMFDVNRVEVLRGPQGTLWGSSAMGGALRIVTNRPDTTETEFRTRLTVSDVADGGNGYGVDAVGNFPLVEDKVALRLTGYTRTDAGYLDAPNIGKSDSNEATVTGARASLRWLPSDSLTIDLTTTYQRLEVDDGAAAFLDNPLDPTQVATAADRMRFNYTPGTTDQKLTMANLVIEYDFGNVQLVSSTTYGDGDLRAARDQTVFESVIASFTTGMLDIYEASFITNDLSSTVTQEIRLLSDNPDSALSWLIGGFYLDSDRELRSGTAVFSNIAMHPLDLFPGNQTFTQDIDSARTEQAIFGEVTWHISDRLDATFGARFFENDQTFSSTLGFAGPPGLPPLLLGSDRSTDESDSTFKFSLAFRPNDDVLLYGLASQGFRLGGTNGDAAVFAPTVAPAEYGSDTLWNYELGARTTLADGRVVLNATLFYIDWSDIQSTFRLDPPLPPIPFFVNAGEAHSQGIEIDLSAQLSENWFLRTAVTSLEAEIDNPEAILGANTGITAGDKLPGTPEFQSSTSLEYSTTIGGRETSFAVNHLHVGEQQFELGGTATTGDYDLFGLLIRSALSDTVDLTLFAKNLGDEDGISGTFPGDAFFFPDIRYVVRPRTIGLSLQVDF